MARIELDQRVCACGHTAHWHGAADPERPAETMGLGRCDCCDCEAMVEVRTDTLSSLRAEIRGLRARLEPCTCKELCCDSDPDGPGTCRGLPKAAAEPLLKVVLTDRDTGEVI